MRLFAILAALTLAACAGAVQVGPAGPDPDPTVIGQGDEPANRIIVYRAAEIGFVANVASAPAILLDGRSVGTCRIGQPLVFKVPDGTWKITALGAGGEVSDAVTIQNGDRVNLRCGVSPAPALSPAPTLVRVETGVAMKEAGL